MTGLAQDVILGPVSEEAKRLLYWAVLGAIFFVAGVLAIDMQTGLNQKAQLDATHQAIIDQMKSEADAAMAAAKARDEAARNSRAVVSPEDSYPSPATSPPDDDATDTTPNQRAIATNTLVPLAFGWLEMIDKGQYNDAYSLQSDRAKAMQSLDAWNQYMQAYRAPAGTEISRSYTGFQVLQVMPTDPATYALTFKTETGTKIFTETVQMQEAGDGTWKYIAYQLGPWP